MYCMKCGKRVPEKQVFCDDCLAVMAQFPVRPETHILLPNRETPVAVKKAPVRKKALSTEDRLARAKKIIQGLSFSLAVVVLALFLSVGLLVETMRPGTEPGAIGQNYNTTDTARNTD